MKWVIPPVICRIIPQSCSQPLSSEHEHLPLSVWSLTVSTDGETDETDSAADFYPGRMAAGVRFFHNATIFLTQASGDGRKICGLGNPDGRVWTWRYQSKNLSRVSYFTNIQKTTRSCWGRSSIREIIQLFEEVGVMKARNLRDAKQKNYDPMKKDIVGWLLPCYIAF